MIMNDYRAYVENDYNSIYHFGILGMKWGIRRYQNPDGSLTAAGKARYLKSDGSLNKEGIKRARFDKFGDNRDTLSKELQRLDWNKHHPKNQQWQEISAWDPKALERKRESSKIGGDITGKQVSDLMKKKGITYDDIYLEMAEDGLLDMESEDNDDFKKAEYEWYKKHSKEIKHSIGDDTDTPRRVERAVEKTLHIDMDDARIFVASGVGIVSGLFAKRDYNRTKKLGAHPKVED